MHLLPRNLLASLISLVLIIISAQQLHAQTGTIEGRGISAETNQPIADVNVGLEGTSEGSITNGQGKYAITRLEPGTYTIVFSFVSYERREIEKTVERGETVTVNASLKPATKALQEVEIIGRKDQSYDTDVSFSATKPLQDLLMYRNK